MATVKLGNTKVANKLISYAEKKAVERDGINCDPEYAKSQFATTRSLHGKTGGIQAHHIIQSFKPGEIKPDQANQVGKDLAERLAKNHECVIYTHADKEHIHNHIVINSVGHEDGRKLHLHKSIDKVRRMSDDVCREKGLSVIKEPSARVRYTQAEQVIIERGQTSWKDQVREAIDHEKLNSKTYEGFKRNLTEEYGIEVKERGKHISFKHPECKKFVRGKTLGLDYERGTIENGFERQTTREKRGIKSSSDILLRRNRENYDLDNSRAGVFEQSDKQEHRGQQCREERDSQILETKRGSKERDDNQAEQAISRISSGNERPKENEPAGDRKDFCFNAERNPQNRGQSSGYDKTDQGHGIQPETDSESELEREVETVRDTTAGNGRDDTGIGRGLSSGNPLESILESLGDAINKAEKIEQKKLQKQQQMKKARTKTKTRGWDMDR